MKINIIGKKYILYSKLLFALVIVFLISCSDQAEQSYTVTGSQAKHEKTNTKAKSSPKYKEETSAATKHYPSMHKYPEVKAAAEDESYTEYAEEADPTEEGSQLEESKPNKLDEYTVVLGADEHMKIPGLPGVLRVWIGSSNFNPKFPSRMIQDETTVPAVGKSAIVEPFAPAFKIDPAETQCIKIHPSGSEVRFKLIPQKSGTFDVSANVYLFDSLDCSGPPIPKTAATLKVTVEVNQKEIFLEKVKDLWNIFWEKLLRFWGAFVALIFALILFLIRGRLKQWFGFDNE